MTTAHILKNVINLALWSDEGCIFLVVWEHPVQVLAAPLVPLAQSV